MKGSVYTARELVVLAGVKDPDAAFDAPAGVKIDGISAAKPSKLVRVRGEKVEVRVGDVVHVVTAPERPGPSEEVKKAQEANAKAAGLKSSKPEADAGDALPPAKKKKAAPKIKAAKKKRG